MAVRVLHIFGKMNRGGAEMRTLDVMPLLADRGVYFDFCTLGEGAGELDEMIRDRGRRVHNCPLRGGYSLFVKKFHQLLVNEHYDIVHSHVHYFSGKIAEIAHRANIPKRIVHFRTLHDGKGINWRRRLYHAYMKYLINRHATNILAVCQGVLDYCWKKWPQDSRCNVIYNGIDLEPFVSAISDRSKICRQVGIEEQQYILINVGSFQPAKAHDVLLLSISQVAKMRQDFCVLLVGDGELKSQMERMADRLGITDYVRFLGKRSDVPDLLKASDGYILSSRREGLPGVVLEALAAQLPVVATNLAGVREIAQYTSNITMVPVENPDALAQGILQVLQRLDSKEFISSAFPPIFERSFCADRLHHIYLA